MKRSCSPEMAILSDGVIFSIPDTGMSGVLVPFTFDLCFWENSVKHSGSDLWSDGSICCQASQVVLV